MAVRVALAELIDLLMIIESNDFVIQEEFRCRIDPEKQILSH